MIEYKRNDEGILEAYKDGELVGSIITMGDEINGGPVDNDKYNV